jgi:nucleotide-binding universal stress UspA family protein
MGGGPCAAYSLAPMAPAARDGDDADVESNGRHALGRRCILCATDGSAGARTLVNVAARLAERLELPLVLVLAIPSAPAPRRGTAADGAAVRESRVTRARQRLGHVAAALVRDGRFGALELAQARTEVGDPPERVAAAADELGAELLVVGARGRRWARTAPLGSVSSALAAGAPCPVVVVPRGARGSIQARPGGASIVCGVDLGDAPAAVAEVALELAERLGLRFVLVHVEPSGAVSARSAPIEHRAPRDPATRAAHRRLALVAEALGADRPEVRVETGEPAAALERVAARESAALLVVGAGGGGGLGLPLLGAVSQRLASTASRPVVLVPPAIVEAIESLLDATSS